ncbi:hypothetical protein ACWG0P_08985 [Amedibacillus sp. YH-ame6]
MNLVKEAIEKAQESNKELYSIEKISLACAISPSTLSNYKSGLRLAPPDVIVSLSAYLHDLGLRDRYCAQECPIGKCKNPNGYCQRDLQTLGFMSGDKGKSFIAMFEEISKIYADGERTRDEELLFKQNNLEWLYQADELVRNLINFCEGIK